MKVSAGPKYTKGIPAAPITSLTPEWIRIPQVTLLFGLSRSHVFAKIADRTLESVHVKRPGAEKGIRLVKIESIRRYLESFAP